MWLDRVKRVYRQELDITWRNFSLEQNAFDLKQQSEGSDNDWKVWNEPDVTKGRSLLSQVAAEAARRQEPELYEKFHLALLKARHGDDSRIPLNDEEVIVGLAAKIGLDTAKLREDMKDPNILTIIGSDHEGARSQGIFGTPTFVFDNGNTMYLKAFIPPEEDAIAEFEHFVAISCDRSYIGEMKRPQPPWPKGVLD